MVFASGCDDMPFNWCAGETCGKVYTVYKRAGGCQAKKAKPNALESLVKGGKRRVEFPRRPVQDSGTGTGKMSDSLAF